MYTEIGLNFNWTRYRDRPCGLVFLGESEKSMWSMTAKSWILLVYFHSPLRTISFCSVTLTSWLNETSVLGSYQGLNRHVSTAHRCPGFTPQCWWPVKEHVRTFCEESKSRLGTRLWWGDTSVSARPPGGGGASQCIKLRRCAWSWTVSGFRTRLKGRTRSVLGYLSCFVVLEVWPWHVPAGVCRSFDVSVWNMRAADSEMCKEKEERWEGIQ